MELGEEEIEDKIEYKINALGQALGVTVEYEQEIENEMMESETETQFDIFFTSLVEYAKSPNSFENGYDWENDEVVQTIPMPETLSLTSLAAASRSLSHRDDW